MGMGDVVRITTAPPKPKLKAAEKLSREKSVNISRPVQQAPAFIVPTEAVPEASAPIAAAVVVKVDTYNLRAQALETERVAAAPTPVAVIQQKTAAVQERSSTFNTTKSAAGKTAKSGNKTSKSGKLYQHKRKKNQTFRLFDGPIFKKKSKSKYGCYKF